MQLGLNQVVLHGGTNSDPVAGTRSLHRHLSARPEKYAVRNGVDGQTLTHRARRGRCSADLMEWVMEMMNKVERAKPALTLEASDAVFGETCRIFRKLCTDLPGRFGSLDDHLAELGH